MTLAVATGLDSFVNPEEIGPMYPFPGLEVLFFGVALFLWLAWHFLQARGETREQREASELYEELGLERVMSQGGSALVGAQEERVQPPDISGSPDGASHAADLKGEPATPPARGSGSHPS